MLRDSLRSVPLFLNARASHPGGLSSCKHILCLMAPPPRQEDGQESLPELSSTPCHHKVEVGGEKGVNHYTVQRADLESSWPSLAGTSCERRKGVIQEAKVSFLRIKTLSPEVRLPVNCATRGSCFKGKSRWNPAHGLFF